MQKVYAFWLIWFITQSALYNHALSVVIVGIGIGIVILCQHWHHLCTPTPGTGLYIEISYLVHICTSIPQIWTSNI